MLFADSHSLPHTIHIHTRILTLTPISGDTNKRNAITWKTVAHTQSTANTHIHADIPHLCRYQLMSKRKSLDVIFFCVVQQFGRALLWCRSTWMFYFSSLFSSFLQYEICSIFNWKAMLLLAIGEWCVTFQIEADRHRNKEKRRRIVCEMNRWDCLDFNANAHSTENFLNIFHHIRRTEERTHAAHTICGPKKSLSNRSRTISLKWKNIDSVKQSANVVQMQ